MYVWLKRVALMKTAEENSIDKIDIWPDSVRLLLSFYVKYHKSVVGFHWLLFQKVTKPYSVALGSLAAWGSGVPVATLWDFY